MLTMSFKIQTSKAQFWAEIHIYWVSKKKFLKQHEICNRYNASPSTVSCWIKEWKLQHSNSDFLFK